MICCYIPARGGSKGIKNKNLIDFNGKPLIQHTIEFSILLKSRGLVDEIFVSSDSDEILTFSKKFDIKPIKRPFNLAKSASRTVDGIIDFLSKKSNFKKNIPSSILTLQPTSPFRSYSDFVKAFELFNLKNIDSVISVHYDETLSTSILYKMENKNYCTPLEKTHNKGTRRQDQGGLLLRNGSFYLTKTSFVIENNSLVSDKPSFVSMSKINSVNIDTYEDLQIARNILK